MGTSAFNPNESRQLVVLRFDQPVPRVIGQKAQDVHTFEFHIDAVRFLLRTFRERRVRLKRILFIFADDYESFSVDDNNKINEHVKRRPRSEETINKLTT